MLKCVGMSVYMLGFMAIIVCVFRACIYVLICADKSVYGVHVS